MLSALEMAQEAPAAGLPPAHVGIHAGPIVVQDGDYFGRTANLAARIAGRVGAGQVLVADEVVAAAESDRVRYEALGPVWLKGSPDRDGFTWPYRPDVAAGWSATRARLASFAGHWRMRTPVGANDTRLIRRHPVDTAIATKVPDDTTSG